MRFCNPLVVTTMVALTIASAGCGTSAPPTGGSPSGSASSAAPSESPSISIPSPAASPQPSPTPLPSSAALPVDEQIAFTSGALGGDQWVVVAAADGSEATRLMPGRDPSWSLDGRTLVSTCPAAGNEGGFPTICSIQYDQAGAEPRQILVVGERPHFSPDGTRLAYHRGMIDVGETWIAGSDGTGAGLLTPGELTAWSPDGTWLAGQPDSAIAEIAIIRPDGSRYRVLTGGYDPAWSPDGGRLAYGQVTANGSSLRLLDIATGTIGGLYLGRVAVELGAPVWLSTDVVLFVMNGDLWRIGSDGSMPVRLTAGLGISGRLSISPDREWVVFATERVDGVQVTSELVVASVEGGWRVLETGDAPVSQPTWRPAAGG